MQFRVQSLARVFGQQLQKWLQLPALALRSNSKYGTLDYPISFSIMHDASISAFENERTTTYFFASYGCEKVIPCRTPSRRVPHSG